MSASSPGVQQGTSSGVRRAQRRAPGASWSLDHLGLEVQFFMENRPGHRTKSMPGDLGLRVIAIRRKAALAKRRRSSASWDHGRRTHTRLARSGQERSCRIATACVAVAPGAAAFPSSAPPECPRPSQVKLWPFSLAQLRSRTNSRGKQQSRLHHEGAAKSVDGSQQLAGFLGTGDGRKVRLWPGGMARADLGTDRSARAGGHRAGHLADLALTLCASSGRHAHQPCATPQAPRGR